MQTLVSAMPYVSSHIGWLGVKVVNNTHKDRTRAAVVRSLVLCTSLTASFRLVEPSFERHDQTEPQFPKPECHSNAAMLTRFSML